MEQNMSETALQRISITQLSEAELEQKGVFSWPVWQKEVSVFPWHYAEREVCYLLQGDVLVTTEAGQIVRFGAGDLVVFPAGLSCTWEILSEVKKHYAFE